MDNLKPCPFCGGEAEAIEYHKTDYTIMCKTCYAEIGWRKKKEAIAAWNRRAEPELTRCEKCDYWDKSASFMSAHACAFWSSGKKTRYTENYDFCSFAERKEE